MSSPVWLITGASSGFGLGLALRALKSQHRVIAAVRNPSKSSDAVAQIEANGGKVVQLDMTDSQGTVAEKIKAALNIYGQVDYLVNNAGYSLLGVIETFTEKEVQLQFQTNVFGPLWATQAILPSMRARGQGTIVVVSSVAGHDAQPSCGAYAASKFALEGTFEALSKEVAEFGLSVLIVDPGAYRTNFLTGANWSEAAMLDDYKNSLVEGVMEKFKSMAGRQKGDPDKAVETIYSVITGDKTAAKGLLRLVVGMDAVDRIDNKTKKLLADLEVSRKLESEASTAVVE